MDLKKLSDFIEKQGFAIVVACGLLFFAWNVYKDSLSREERLVNRVDSFDKTLKEFGETLKTIDSRLDKIEQQSTDLQILIPAATAGE